MNSPAMNNDNQTAVKLNCPNILKSKYMEVFFHSFCTLTKTELNNKPPPLAVVIIGNSYFSVLLKHRSNHDISAASLSADSVFRFKSIRSKMHVYLRHIFFRISCCLFLWLLFKRKLMLHMLMRNPRYEECEQNHFYHYSLYFQRVFR